MRFSDIRRSLTPERRRRINQVKTEMVVDEAIQALLEERTRLGFTEPIAFIAIAQARTRILKALRES